MSSTSAARYRKPVPHSQSTNPVGEQEKAELKAAVKQQAAATSAGLSVLDVLRILGGILLLSSGLSYLSTNGESMTWGYNAWWTRAREWKAVLQREVHLTDQELLQYDGTDPNKPIYLALNGTIYDVSISPQTYGPGGSYHFFAGRDAARAFLTGCFQEDATPDLRGVEQMYIPIDPEQKPDATPEDIEKARNRKSLTAGERKNRHAQELRQARKQVTDGLENWHKMFRGEKGKKYYRVGEVKREEGWMEKLPVRKLCEQAEKGRPIRKYD
ncbi:cytochrome b5 [Setomelanomma holmii]|uniref:Cytochrome b5 n=1 Tax=Setomelanomma holmii TaxID=210430 RepID=A0A9P4H3K5_9PLEO|nr:cytochrome b5 [Setomelanomma holmii]